MPIRIRTLDEMHELALVYARGMNTGINTARFSGFWWRSRAVAALAMGANNAAAFLLEQIFASTAQKTYLEKHAEQVAISRRSARKARGKILVVTTTPTNGSPTVNVSIGASFEHASGLTFSVLTANTTIKQAWTGKTIAYGSTERRIVVSPDASSIDVDDVFTLAGVTCAARAVLPETGTQLVVDLYPQLATAPSLGGAITPLNGCVLEVECDTTGVEGNISAGEYLTHAISGLGANAIVLEMSGGASDADDAELRSRVLAYKQERPGAGNRADYREWARETPDVGVLDAFVYPSYRGLGTVDLVCFGVPGRRALGTASNALVLAYIQSKASGHDDIRVRTLTDGSSVDVELVLTPGTGYEPDWLGVAATSGVSTTTQLSCASSTAYDAIEIGDRVVVHTLAAGRTRLEQRTVVGKAGLILSLDPSEPLLSAPASGASVWPGGPLVQPTIDAVDAYFDALGPGDFEATRYPSYDETGDAVVRVAALEALAMSLTGCVDVEVSEPAANVVPATFARPILGALTITFAT